jgi:bacteriocin biosynthesis cyclodehydratase domain-containing protein
VVGSLLALEVLQLLMGRAAATEGRALLVDMPTLETRWESIERDPRCPVCGPG